jgi:hypothetical protein
MFYMLYAKDIASDWLKVGTMSAVSQWLKGGSLTDTKWQMETLFVLLGFTAYHLSTRNFLTPTGLDGVPRMIADDTIKVGTMFVVSRLLSGGGLMDRQWITACMATLIGFAVYNIVVGRYIKGSDVTGNPKLQMVVDDWAKAGTMMVVSRLISCESLLDPAWAQGALGTLLGFTAYDMVTSHVIDKLFG